MKKFLLMNGPNMDMLGIREPGTYGSRTLGDLESLMRSHAKEREVDLQCFQSNHEGALIDRLHGAHFEGLDGIVYNPAAHTHYSYAIRDAVAAIDVPVVEVHVSDVDAREPFRAVSVIAPACVAQIKGFGFDGYLRALDGLLEGWSTPLGEGFDRLAQGKIIVGGESGPTVLSE